jgi:predicted ATP-binding protein involved in virulence
MMEDQERRDRERLWDITYKSPVLQAVRNALGIIVKDYINPRIETRPLRFIMDRIDKDGSRHELRIEQLSEGYKIVIAMVADLAARMAEANPEMENPLNTSGIVLIDEVDLHLHPSWQISVISKLKNTFKNIQFFITTHSPIVASDAEGAVFSVKDGLVNRENTYGKLSSNILSSVFGISMARNLYVQSLIESAYTNLDNGNSDAFNTTYSELETILGADDIDLAKLRIEKFRRERSRS